MTTSSSEQTLIAHVRHATRHGEPLRLQGHDSKRFYGREVQGQTLSLAEHQGVVDYTPSELVITVKAGTPLRDLHQALAEAGQYLPFDPPEFADQPATGTIGGAVASGLCGPGRPWLGAVRDFVLGARLLNGQGQVLSFGGQVMKNVAGYDVSRLLAGSLGVLGVVLEVSLKVLPAPPIRLTLCRRCGISEARSVFTALSGTATPLAGACYVQESAWLRLQGSELGVTQAAEQLTREGWEPGEDAFWETLRDHTHDFFAPALEGAGLWRLSVPATAPVDAHAPCVLDWGGAQRWVLQQQVSEQSAARVREWAAQQGGHATLFRGHGAAPFHPLPSALSQLHQRIKRSFDPAGIFNPGRWYETL